MDEPAGGETYGWLAKLDRESGTLTQVTQLPAPGWPGAVHRLDGRVVVVQPTSGWLWIWIGDF
ncbi:MAG TPA: hypothetical protein VFV02_01590 [Acidimicrobiales bacterium]|nr:hypothetical protein [Acidimicrobiales bacterium]